jgi:hypothetical protein
LKAIEDIFSGAYEKDKKAQKQLVEVSVSKFL